MIPRGPSRWMLAAVAVVFLASGASKAVDGRTAVGIVATFLSSFEAGRLAVAVLTGVEVAVGVLLVLRPTRDLAWFAALMLAAMTAWMVHIDVTRGMDVPCGCGVPFLGEKGWAPLVRNGVLLALCLASLRRGGESKGGDAGAPPPATV